MELSTPIAALTTSVTHADTGIPGLIGDMSPLITVGVVVGMLLALLGRVLGV